MMEAREVMVAALDEAVREVERALEELEKLPPGVHKELVLLRGMELPPIPLSGDSTLRMSVRFWDRGFGLSVTRKASIGASTMVFEGAQLPRGEKIIQHIVPERPSLVLEVVRGLEAWAEEVRRVGREAREAYARRLEEEKEALDELRVRAALRGLEEA